MRKLISIFLCVILVFAMTACDNRQMPDKPLIDKDKTQTDTNTEGNLTETESIETEPNIDTSNGIGDEFLRYEDIMVYTSDYPENYDTMKSLQGKIQHIFSNESDVTFIADNHWYIPTWETLHSIAEIPENTEFVQFFRNPEIGQNMIYVGNNKISCIDDYGTAWYSNIDFQFGTDIPLHFGFDSYIFILSVTENGHVLKYYSTDNSEEIEYTSEKPLEYIQFQNFEKLEQAGQIVCMLNTHKGFDTFFVTDDNSVYEIYDADSNCLILTTDEPIAKNIDMMYCRPQHDRNMISPIYSKADDTNNLYAMMDNNDIGEISDNIEISFIMPDEHVHSELVKIEWCGSRIVFVFANGDTYITEEIERDVETAYTLQKLESISKLIADGTIIDIASNTAFVNNYIYLLTVDGYLYAYPVDVL